jgi:hypothetical protein
MSAANDPLCAPHAGGENSMKVAARSSKGFLWKAWEMVVPMPIICEKRRKIALSAFLGRSFAR